MPVITGMGAVTPIGCGVDKYWNSLVEGRCGIDRISRFDAENLAVKIAAEVRDFDVESYMPRKIDTRDGRIHPIRLCRGKGSYRRGASGGI